MEGKVNFIREVFNIFDKESEGCIKVKDLPTICKYLFLNETNETDIKLMFGLSETESFDSDSKIIFEDFYLSIHKHQIGIKLENVEEAFKRFDKKGTGRISKIDLKTILESEHTLLCIEDINEIIEQYGLNGTDEIEYNKIIEEFFLKS
jgi:Ca2+-binding EF-hand superfamily protein